MADQTVFQRLMNNVDFIRDHVDHPLLDEYWYSFDNCRGLPSPLIGVSDEPKDDLTVAQKIISISPFYIKYIGKNIIKDKSILKSALDDAPDVIDMLPGYVIHDPLVFDDELARIIVDSRDKYAIAHLDDRYKNLHCLPNTSVEEINNQYSAISMLLEITSNSLGLSNKVIPISQDIAFKLNSIGMENGLCDKDIDLCIEFVNNKHEWNYRSLTTEIKDCHDMILEMYNFRDNESFNHISDRLLNNEKFMSTALEKSPLSFAFCGNKLKTNIPFIRKYASKRFIIIGYCPKIIQDDVAFMSDLLKDHGIALNNYL